MMTVILAIVAHILLWVLTCRLVRYLELSSEWVMVVGFVYAILFTSVVRGLWRE